MILEIELSPPPPGCIRTETQAEAIVRHLVDAIITAWSSSNVGPAECTAGHIAKTIVKSKALNLSLVAA